MDNNIFKVLDYLDDFIFGSPVDISSLMNKIFPFKKGLSEDEFNRHKNLVNRFLDGLEKPKYVTFNIGTRSNIGQYETKINKWFDGYELEVLITEVGLEAIAREKFNKTIKHNSQWQTYILIAAFVISCLSLYIALLNYQVIIYNVDKQHPIPSKKLTKPIKVKPTILLNDKTLQEKNRTETVDSVYKSKGSKHTLRGK